MHVDDLKIVVSCPIKNDNELVDRDCKIASKRLKNLISTLEKISELVNEGIW